MLPALLVHRDDLEIEVPTAQRLEVLDRLDVHERTRQERLDADVDGEASLDPVDHAAADGRAGAVGLLHLVPHLHLLGLVLGEDDVAVLVLGALEQDIHRVAGLDEDVAGEVGELGDGDDSLRLVSDIDDHLGWRDSQHAAPDDLTLLEVLEGVLVLGEQVLVLLGRQLLLFGFGLHWFGSPASFVVFSCHWKRDYPLISI